MVKPGLTGFNLNTSFNGGLKKTAANNISTAPRATGNATRANIRPAGNGANGLGVRKTQGFGIMAQRSAVGTGAHLNAKNYFGSSLERENHQLNARAFNNQYEMTFNQPHNHGVSGNNGMNKFAAAMVALQMVGELTNQVVDAVGDIKASRGTNGTGKANGTGAANGAGDAKSTGSPASLDGMKGAKDSSTLRGAIESAKTDVSTKESALQTLESQLPEMKKASEAATEQLKDLEPKVDAKQKEVDGKQQEVKSSEEGVKNAKQNLDGAEKRLASCDKAFNAACEKLATAEKGLSTAEAKLANTPEYITDSEGNQVKNPQYDAAKQAVETAKKEVQDAQKEKQEAAGTLEQAKADNNTAKQRYLESQDKLEKAEADLTKAQGELKELNEQLDKLKQEQVDAQKQVKAYEDAVKQQEQLKSDIEQLKAEIPKQEQRLAELEQKEEASLADAESTILEMNDKKAGKDGILGNDDDKKLRNRNENKMNDAMELRRNVNYTKLYKTAGETINGQTFRTGSYNGETLYMIGAKKVDEQEFNEKMAGAKLVQDGNAAIRKEQLDD